MSRNARVDRYGYMGKSGWGVKLDDGSVLRPGVRVRSTDSYANTFPRHIEKNGHRPLRGVVRRINKRGHIVVRWGLNTTDATLAPEFVCLDGDPIEAPDAENAALMQTLSEAVDDARVGIDMRDKRIAELEHANAVLRTAKQNMCDELHDILARMTRFVAIHDRDVQ